MADLWLYNLRLRPPSNTFTSVIGHFSGDKKNQELVLATNCTLEVYRLNRQTSKLEKFQNQKVLSLIQRIEKVRLVGTQTDLLALTADSGTLTLSRLDKTSKRFVPVAQHPHSKPALRRLTPGEYLYAEPRGRAILVAAIERDLLVYKVEPQNQSVALLSPLTVAANNVITLTMCALDTNYENPMWVAIEAHQLTLLHGKPLDSSAGPLLLTYYELDQGLNHVVRRNCKHDLPASATALISIPGHVGGVVICCGTYLIYEDSPVNNNRLYLPLPIRENTTESPIVCHILHTLRKPDFFLLLQSSYGDLFKVTLNYDLDKERVTSLKATYFDTIPVCSSIGVFRSGHLFANSFGNNKVLYQFVLLGEENDTTVRSTHTIDDFPQLDKFKPRELTNLTLVDEVVSLAPLLDSALDTSSVGRLVVASSDLYLKTLNHGVSVTELVSSPLPSAATDVYSVRLLRAATNDQYLVLSSSLSEKTLVLSVGEVVEEVSESGFDVDQHTLAVQQVGASSLVQVHTHGIRRIRHTLDNDLNVVSKSVTDWFPPAGISVLHASCNTEQIVVALSNREIVYFEIDQTDDQLVEYQERYEVNEGAVTAVAVATCLLSELRSSFLVVACSDESIQVLSLLPHNIFEVLTLQALSSACRSLLVLPLDRDTQYVHIGMDNGIYVRVGIDTVSGKLFDSRLKYLGTLPVRLRSLKLPNMKHLALLAFSSSVWLGFFNYDNNLRLFPLLGTSVTTAASFYSDDIGIESVVGVRGDNLSIFTVGEENGLDYNSDFVVSSVKLQCTPRRLIKGKEDFYYVMECQKNQCSSREGTDQTGWTSCIQVVDQSEHEVIQTIKSPENERLVCITLAAFDGSMHLVVGAVKEQSCCIKTFKVGDDHQIEPVHTTATDAEVTALVSFGSRLVAAVDNQLRVYEMGKKQLVKKSSTALTILTRVTKLENVEAGLFVVSDATSSVLYLVFDSSNNRFVPLVSDTMPRAVTAFASLDKRNVIAGDKFGNIFVNSVPLEVARQISNNVLSQFQDDYLNGPSFRLTKSCDFYLGDIVTSFHKGSFVVGGKESIIYTGLQGTVGVMLPLSTRQEAQFLLKFEKSLRKWYERELDDVPNTDEKFNLVGRDQTKFRGYYNPVKNVIDGDFLEKYYELGSVAKIKIAGELGRVPREVERKLYDLRNRGAF